MGLAVTILGVILAATSFAQSSSGPANKTSEATNHAVDGAASPAPDHNHAHLIGGVTWALVAALSFGFLFWFLGFYVVPVVGPVISVWVNRLTCFSVLALIAAPTRQSLKLPGGSVWWLLAAVGFLDTAAFVANNAGLGTGQVSIVSVLASLTVPSPSCSP